MHKFNFANRFGLAISFVFLSLFPPTSALAQKTSAAAGSGTQQVIVTNTAAQPVPVTMQQPGSMAFQSGLVQFTAAPGNTNLKTLVTVPAGKRLVVDYISGACSNLSGYAALGGVTGGSFSGFVYLPIAYNTTLISMPIRLYVNPGEDFDLFINNIGFAGTGCSFTASGYYVNAQ